MGNISFDWHDLLDIVLVSILLHQIIHFLRGSRAVAVLTGLGLLAVCYFASYHLGIYTISWILQHFGESLLLVLVIIFQSDIRQALGEIGAKRLFRRSGLRKEWVEELVVACVEMAHRRVGALIVLEQNVHLDDMISREGVRLDAKIDRRLLMNIFYPKAPLHDGAVIVSHGRIAAAACILPLAVVREQNFGTRHRAGLGITLETDAVSIIVSEERGEISLAMHGNLVRDMTGSQLRQELDKIV